MYQHPEGQYIVREGEIDGSYAVISVNYALKDYPHKYEFPWNLKVVVDIKEKNYDHLPTNQEAAILDTFEDRIGEILSKVCSFHFIGRMSWNGERTIMFYLDEPQKAHEVLSELIEEVEVAKEKGDDAGSVREFEYEMRKDESWSNVDIYFN